MGYKLEASSISQALTGAVRKARKASEHMKDAEQGLQQFLPRCCCCPSEHYLSFLPRVWQQLSLLFIFALRGGDYWQGRPQDSHFWFVQFWVVQAGGNMMLQKGDKQLRRRRSDRI